MRTAVDSAVRLHTVTHDRDAAASAFRRNDADGALERIEYAAVAVAHENSERLIVIVPAPLAACHLDLPATRRGALLGLRGFLRFERGLPLVVRQIAGFACAFRFGRVL